MLPRLFTRSDTSRATRTRFRPRVEGLEGREVPAAFTWLGGNPSDHLSWDGPENEVPDYDDDVYFDGDRHGSNCDLFRMHAAQFKSIRLVDSYPGTVTWYGGQLEVLELTSGALATPYSSLVTVSKQFTWTGGILNSTEDLGALSMLGGATASIDPGASKTVVTGSTLNFTPAGTTGSTGTFNPGTVQFNNGAGIVIEQYCQVRTPQPGVNVRRNTIDSSGNVTVRGEFEAGGWDSEAGLLIDGGTVTITGGRTARFIGKIPDLLGAEPSVKQSSGLLSIQSGGMLQTRFGYHMYNGELRTTFNPAPIWPQKAIIDPGEKKVYIGGGFVDINQAGYGELYVSGDLDWSGGEYIATVDATFPTRADLLHCSGLLRISSTPSVRTDVKNAPPGGIGGLSWDIIKADGGATGINPGLSVAAGWQMLWNPGSTVGTIRKIP